MTNRLVSSTLFLFAALAIGETTLATKAHAEQVIPRIVEYSNDSISDQGKTVACVVAVVIVSPPDQRTLNFQFLSFKERAGWKITGGLMNWATQTMTALIAQDGSFSSSAFVAPRAFAKSLTPEGQLVGVLTQPDRLPDFVAAFFKGRYVVAVRWQRQPNELTYYVDKPPSTKVKSDFLDCIKNM